MSLPSITEYTSSISTPQLLKVHKLQGGHPVDARGRVMKYTGGFCVVFPYKCGNKKYAVRCWHVNIQDIQKRTQLISEALHNSKLSYFVGFEYVENGIMTAQGMQPLVVMDWVEALPLKKYIKKHLFESAKIQELANNFKQMVSDLHRCKFSHGDLQHGNIMVKDGGQLVLVDYDSMYVPALDGWDEEIKGLQGYQHEARWKNKKLTPKADYFSELIIYLSLLGLSKYPNLWNDLNIEDTETLLFSLEDIKSKGCTPIFDFLGRDSSLSLLVSNLIAFLQADTLDDLQPLEAVLVSKVDTISDKWKDNGYRPKIVDYKAEADLISNKW